MFEDKIVLAVANTYEKLFYLNNEFEALPQQIKDELKIICVKHVAEVGGIITMYYDEDGTLQVEVMADEEDILYDEIGSHLKVKQMLSVYSELFENLETFFKVFYLGEG